MYVSIEQWFDKELYRGLYGTAVVEQIPPSHRDAILELLSARAALYRALARGAADPQRSPEYTGEVGNERMAQAIDACLKDLGTGPNLPPIRHWDEFWPGW